MTEAGPTRRRGAVRSEEARLAVLGATASLFATRGYDHLTIEGIAAEAGVAKQTIYRWWPSKAAVVAETLIEGKLLPEVFSVADTGDLRADLAAWLDELHRFIDEPRNGSLIRSLLAAAAESPEIGAMLHDAIGGSDLARRIEGDVAGGELAPDTPVQEVIEALVGAAVMRTLRRTPSTPGTAQALVGLLLR